MIGSRKNLAPFTNNRKGVCHGREVTEKDRVTVQAKYGSRRGKHERHGAHRPRCISLDHLSAPGSGNRAFRRIRRERHVDRDSPRAHRLLSYCLILCAAREDLPGSGFCELRLFCGEGMARREGAEKERPHFRSPYIEARHRLVRPSFLLGLLGGHGGHDGHHDRLHLQSVYRP